METALIFGENFLKHMPIANDLKHGNVVKLDGGNYKVVKTEHVKPGKGGAFIQAELKNIKTGAKLNTRFRSDTAVDMVFVETRKASFMYDDSFAMVLMFADTFDQIEVPYALFGNGRLFVNEDVELTLEIVEENVINVFLPTKVSGVVKETELAIKNQTATNSFKPATLENGFKLSVPPFIGMGETVVINTETWEYVERKK
ncbi:MAG: elongation factor P [Candidatus Deianiraeaceae bacterium]